MDAAAEEFVTTISDGHKQTMISANPLRMFSKDTDILNTLHAGRSRAGDGLVMDHFFLQPEIRNTQPDYVFDYRRHVLRCPEHVNQVESLG